jgi:hypothetical protein
MNKTSNVIHFRNAYVYKYVCMVMILMFHLVYVYIGLHSSRSKSISTTYSMNKEETDSLLEQV